VSSSASLARRARRRNQGLLAPLAASLALWTALPACNGEAAADTRGVVEAVDRFRRASEEGKGAALAALEAAPCHAKDVCSAKDACVASARPTARGYALMHEVEREIQRLDAGILEAGMAEAEALPGKLVEARQVLDEGQAKRAGCDRALVDLRLKYTQ
jgi:hypothetical protein